MSPNYTLMICALFLYTLLQVKVYLQKSSRLLRGEWVWDKGRDRKACEEADAIVQVSNKIVRWRQKVLIWATGEKRGRGKWLREMGRSGKGRLPSSTDGLVGVFRGSEGSGRGPMSTRKELREKPWMAACPSQLASSGDLVREMTLNYLLDPEWYFFLREFTHSSAMDGSSTSSFSCQCL